jgi:hypothetical protein
LARLAFRSRPLRLAVMPGMLRAAHLLFNTLNGPTADATLAGNSQDAFADAQLSLDALFDGGIDPRPTELLALRYGALKASVHALPDHAALKLGKRAADLKHQAPSGRIGITLGGNLRQNSKPTITHGISEGVRACKFSNREKPPRMGYRPLPCW